jgi:IrrE N-terminal-like domain
MTMEEVTLVAQTVLDACGLDHAGGVELTDILYSRGISLIRNAPLTNAEGRILLRKDRAIVTVNASISYAPKRRFILAHELGHYELHRGLADQFIERVGSLDELSGPTNSLEAQANAFASELLIPYWLVMQTFNEPDLFDQVSQLATYCQTSLTATALRMAELSPFPLVVFCTQASRIQWCRHSPSWSFPQLSTGQRIPPRSITEQLSRHTKGSADSIDAHEWIQVVPEHTVQFQEACYPIAPGVYLSLLWHQEFVEREAD